MAATIENKSSDSLAAAIFAVFAAAVIIAFMYFRGGDVGQLPKLVGNIGGGPLFGPGSVDSSAGVVVGVLIGVSWFGLGNVISRLVKREIRSSKLFEIAFTTAIGSGIWSLIWFFLGLAAIEPSRFGRGNGSGAGILSLIWFYVRVVGLYSGPIAVAAVLIGIATAVVGVRWLRKSNEGASPTGRRSILENVLLLMIAFVGFVALIASFAPPTAKDTLLYHFAVPKAFIAQGGSAFVDGNIASYLALGAEMHTVWAMLLGNLISSRAGEAAAGVTMFLFFPLLLFAAYGWARESGISRTWSLIAILMVASVPTAFHVASSGYIDIALALFVTLGIYSLCRWWSDQTNDWLLTMAILLGAALSIKLTAIFVFAAFALVIVLRAREAKEATGRVLIGGFGALILAGAIASPWYLRTWKATGSPVFPFYMSIWKGEANGWDVERSNLFQGMNAQYGGEQKNSLDYLLAPVNISTIAQPEEARYFDGVLGVAFLIGLPILIWALWKFDVPIEAKIGAGIAAIMFLFWLFSSQQLRYLLPIVPVLAIAIAAAAGAIAAKRELLRTVWQWSLIAASVAGILTTAAWFLQKAPLRVALGGESREQYLARNLDYYPYYQTINADTAAGDRVWLINMRRDTYNIDRPFFSDYLFEDWTLRKMLWESRSVQELKAKTAAMGVKYVLTRHDFLFDYDRSSLVDDKKPRAENEAKLKIARDFILDPANTVRADNKFSLIKVF